MEKHTSVIPLEKLVSTDKNVYELTNAAIHRARQLSLTQNDDTQSDGVKLVSLAIKEIMTGEVQYNSKKS